MKAFFRPGAALAGLVAVVFGLLALAVPSNLPPPDVEGGAETIQRIMGTIGGGLIGLGVVMMAIGVLRSRR
jgi:hypothetical protein